MSARIFLIVMMVISLFYNFIKERIADSQRKKPLPKEVADVYDEEQYRKYLNRVADLKKVDIISTVADVILTITVILSPFYGWIGEISDNNPYKTVVFTYLAVWAISLIPSIAKSYYITFHIQEKYGLNKMDGKEFAKDTVLSEVMELVLTGVIITIFVFIGENMGNWTNGFSVDFVRALGLMGIIVLVLWCVIKLLGFFSLLILKIQYRFIPLEDGHLKEEINRLQADAKKKVKKIFVYNESKKSTGKNAFLLKHLWIREFGIADNFMDENSEKELLAVLSHEIGHLKHKKNILNYLSYVFLAVLLVIAAYLIANPDIIFKMNNWIRESFNLRVNNYYLIFIVLGDIIKPLMLLYGIFMKYKSRFEEYEADGEAVKNGYGRELITTFKRLSSDELVNVNPHPVIEFLEYDHPGMYNRIKAIEGMEAEIS